MSFAARIEALKGGYLERTSVRVAALRQRIDDKPEAAMPEARMIAHDVAGTAPVMGLGSLGECARAVEDAACEQRVQDVTDGLAELAALIERERMRS